MALVVGAEKKDQELQHDGNDGWERQMSDMVREGERSYRVRGKRGREKSQPRGKHQRDMPQLCKRDTTKRDMVYSQRREVDIGKCARVHQRHERESSE